MGINITDNLIQEEHHDERTPVCVFHDMVQDNGKTIKEENLEKGHNIPIGTLVETKYSTWHGAGACEKVHVRLWVVAHERDCDGTPLYTLCKNRNPSEGIVHMDGYILKDYMSVAIINDFVTGIREERLKTIELTEEVKDGHGSLNWEEENE